MSWHMVLHLYSLINSCIDSQIFNNCLLCSGFREGKDEHVVCVSKALGCPCGCGCGGAQSRGEAGVLRKDSEAFREKVAFKLKQKNLPGRVEMFCAANKEKEVWDLKVF